MVAEAGYFAIEPVIFGPAVGVVWVSSNDSDWQRVLDPWPPPAMFDILVSADIILIPGTNPASDHEDELIDWVGVIKP